MPELTELDIELLTARKKVLSCTHLEHSQLKMKVATKVQKTDSELLSFCLLCGANPTDM